MPGAYLKQLRERLGLSVRQVERLSRIVADAKRKKEYFISHGWLTKLEREQSIPGIFTLVSLSVIYRTSFMELLSLYDTTIGETDDYTLLTKLTETHLVTEEFSATANTINSHTPSLRNSSAPGATTILSSMLEESNDISISMLRHLGFKIGRYGYIGLNDYMLYPMLRPGALVLIDENQDKVASENWQSEYDRPIYFLELQGGFACAWCKREGDQITLIPHQLSPSPPQHYHYPRDVRIVGRVVSAFSHFYDPGGKNPPQAHSPPDKRTRSGRRQ